MDDEMRDGEHGSELEWCQGGVERSSDEGGVRKKFGDGAGALGWIKIDEILGLQRSMAKGGSTEGQSWTL